MHTNFFLRFLKRLSLLDWFIGLEAHIIRVSYKPVSFNKTCNGHLDKVINNKEKGIIKN